MKGKDLKVIFLVAVFSAVVSILLSNQIFAPSDDKRQSVETVEAISTDFPRPDSQYFNSGSVNPAKDIQVGQDPGSNPFDGL